MKYQREWLRSLPLGLAVRLIMMWAIRRLTGLPISFSFAQGAEDIIIPHIVRYHFGIQGPGSFVDVGCNAPVRYSNTFALYLLGWRGINIDANKTLVGESQRVRKLDTAVHAAVSDSVKEVIF